jgi:hypothetical protein
LKEIETVSSRKSFVCKTSRESESVCLRERERDIIFDNETDRKPRVKNRKKKEQRWNRERLKTKSHKKMLKINRGTAERETEK